MSLSAQSAIALDAWSFDPWIVALLIVSALFYARGFRALRRLHPERVPGWRGAAFLGGLLTLLVATCSPIDAFADLLLQAHMLQHLLLMMVAPPLIWLGAPINPILHGLPPGFRKQGLGPFLAWPRLRSALRTSTHPLCSGLVFVLVTWIWHLPQLYELALRSSFWHDVEHLCFIGSALLFWYPIIQPWPGRAQWPRAALIGYVALAGVQMSIFSAIFTFSERVFYPSYLERPRLWGISALSDQTAAGAIMWIPSSLILLATLVWVVVEFLEPSHLDGGRATNRRPDPSPRRRRLPADLLRSPWLGPLIASRGFRIAMQTLLFGLALAIVLDGLFGPAHALHNLAGVLPWTHWRGMLVIALLVAGNLFCAACPFTLSRGLARRLLGGRLPLPGWLRTKWTAVVLFASFLIAYEIFDLWASPWWTAWIVIGYFAAALLVDGLFGGATFCRSICPIGQFNFLASSVSPLEVGLREPSRCGSCRTHDCVRGGAAGPGCAFDLFQPTKFGNLDCTFCLDCVRACPHDNVGLFARVPGRELISGGARAGIGRLAQRPDLAIFATLFSFGAFVNAAAMVSPVTTSVRQISAQIPHISESTSTALGLLIALIGLPLLATSGAARLGLRLAKLDEPRPARTRVIRRLRFSFIPLGFAMWLTHFSFHLFTAHGSLEMVIDRWGLRLPSFALGSALPAGPDFWMPIEILVLGMGLWGTLLVGWRIALDLYSTAHQAFRLAAPSALLALGLWTFGVWILFQPMEMRGMMMPGMEMAGMGR
jgi:cytochrome c oxidase assembly factor CtaG